jgi:hypothetical protein
MITNDPEYGLVRILRFNVETHNTRAIRKIFLNDLCANLYENFVVPPTSTGNNTGVACGSAP